MVSSDNTSGNWVEELPAVLLGLRSTVKKGLGLPLPKPFMVNPCDFQGASSRHPRIHHPQVSSMMSAVILRHGSEGFSRGLEALRAASHVLIRQDQVRPPLTQTYKGPYRVISRSRDYFTLDLDGQEDSISISRFIPCR